ncbi:unnamed protein product [Owenia fusiformis]|uniref:Palmitoyltransferase n=1 Tax=Owenia fusiformis TaxID=6347 RepID=A0A8S4NQ77_OWEFU|nr:unnamed protein product [Owenia fusiformis]
MAVIRWRGWSVITPLTNPLKRAWMNLKLTRNTLFYNSFTNWSAVMDTLFAPMFWCVDKFVHYLGPIFVLLVVVLTTTVVVIFYVCLLPHKYDLSLGWTIYHLIFGHWLLINIVFNYFMAAFTDPGHPPQAVPEVVSICKKCIAPKPPRAHHCSICDTCVMKMDHHCPWLNNCVGHYNHRYFFMFCTYMWIGTIYVCVCAKDLFREHFLGPEGFAAVTLAPQAVMQYLKKKTQMYEQIEESEVAALSEDIGEISDEAMSWFHQCIIYEFLLCSGVAVALGFLVAWHGRLITRGETSIEVHTNKKERARLKKKGLVFRNPYDFGPVGNWRKLFGLGHGRTFLRHILLPSTHAPLEDGLKWQTTTYKLEDSPLLLL